MANGSGDSTGAARRSTLYRLIDTDLANDDLRKALAEYYSSNPDFTVESTQVDGVPALAVWGIVGKKGSRRLVRSL